MYNNELLEIAIDNGFLQRAPDGKTRSTRKSFRLVKDFFKTDSAKRAGLSIDDPIDIHAVILLLVEKLVQMGHVE